MHRPGSAWFVIFKKIFGFVENDGCDNMVNMNALALKELKTTAKSLESLVRTAKKQLLLVRIEEAERNISSGNVVVTKNVKDLLK